MQMENRKQSIPKHPAVIWSRFKFRWPFIVWLLAILLAAVLFLRTGTLGPLTGVVDVVRESVAPVEPGRLLSIEVVPGQPVKKGDIIARMDSSILDAELELTKLEMESQFSRAVQRIQGDLQDQKIRQAEVEAELHVLDDEAERLTGLLKKRLVDAQTVARVTARQSALSKASELYPARIKQLEEELSDVKRQQREAKRWLGSEIDSDAPDRLGLLQMKKEDFTLKANADGYVSRILHEPGEVLPGGESVLSIVVKGSTQIIGFLPESQAHDVKVGMKAAILHPTRKLPPIAATVKAMGPEILPLPGRVSPVPGQNVRGRRVILVPNVETDLLPGETVSIQLEVTEGRWGFAILSKKADKAAKE